MGDLEFKQWMGWLFLGLPFIAIGLAGASIRAGEWRKRILRKHPERMNETEYAELNARRMGR